MVIWPLAALAAPPEDTASAMGPVDYQDDEKLVAALAEGQLIANFWLRRGDAACVNHAAGFVRSTLAGLPAHIRIALVRADGGFCSREFLDALRELRQRYIVAQPLRAQVQRLCRHDDAHWRDTGIAGVQVQEVAG